LSPAGTDDAQCTSDGGPAWALEVGEAADEGVAVVALDVAVCDAVGGETLHPATTSIEMRTAPLARTR
jgi:hypothetical protein